MINVLLQYLAICCAIVVFLIIVAVVGTALGWWDWPKSIDGDNDNE